MSLDSIKSGVNTVLSAVSTNPIAAAVGGAGLGVAAGVGITSAVGAIKRRKAKRRKTRNSRKRSYRTKRRKKRYSYARTARKGKDRSSRRIRMTKSGQPYIILASGKARFIKKSSARRSRKLKGGRY